LVFLENAWLQRNALKTPKSWSRKTWRAWVRDFQAPLKTKKKLNEKAEWDQAKKNKFFLESPFSKSRFSKIFMRFFSISAGSQKIVTILTLLREIF